MSDHASPETPHWLDWASRLRTISQNGLNYAHDHYDIDRCHEIAEIAAEMLAAGAGAATEQILEMFSQETGHATPKVDVRVAVFRDESSASAILLVRERGDGRWTLPGGWADVGDSPAEAARREVREESGLDVKITRLLAVYDRRKHPHPPHPFHIYKLFFEGTVIGGQPDSGDGLETDGAQFFPPDALPELSLGRTLPDQVGRMFELHQAPQTPPDFD